MRLLRYAALALATGALLLGLSAAPAKPDQNGVLLLKVKCARKDGKACFDLAMTFTDRINALRLAGNYRDAREPAYYEYRAEMLACRYGYKFDACRNAGEANWEDSGVAFDPVKAIAFFQRDCDLNGERPCTEIAKRVDAARDCVAKNSTWHCGEWGGLYFAGAGVPQDYAKAREFLRIGCKTASRFCPLLAELLIQGQGGPADPVEGLKVLTEACETRAAYGACARAARLTFAAATDADIRFKAWQLAGIGCGGHDGDSCLVKAQAHLEGWTAKPDPVAAKNYLVHGCMMGSVEACWQRAAPPFETAPGLVGETYTDEACIIAPDDRRCKK